MLKTVSMVGGIILLAIVFFTASTYRYKNGEAPLESVLALDEENKEVVIENPIKPKVEPLLKKKVEALSLKANALSTKEASNTQKSLERRIEETDVLLAKVGVTPPKLSNSVKSPQQERIAALQSRLDQLQTK